jgi:3-oxoacyl-[acyl-carrier-protein] synthase III
MRMRPNSDGGLLDETMNPMCGLPALPSTPERNGISRLPPALPAPVSLLSVATAVPETVITQVEAKELARGLFGKRASSFERLAPVFDNAGIEKRHIVRPIDWYHGDHGWKVRNDVYLEAAEALYIEAAEAALARAGVTADEVDALVTVSTTGIATPSLEARVAGRMGFRRDVERVPLFGLGCAGGVSGLATAARLTGTWPGKILLFVTVELCSTSIRLDKLTKANIVATALFGDGAAAAVLRAARTGRLPSKAVPRYCGRTRSASWAGMWKIPASASSSTARFRLSSRRIWARLWRTFSTRSAASGSRWTASPAIRAAPRSSRRWRRAWG